MYISSKLCQQISQSKYMTGGPGYHKIYCKANRQPKQLSTIRTVLIVKSYLQTRISWCALCVAQLLRTQSVSVYRGGEILSRKIDL